MFYISTADRLQRTSVWLESLEGGLDYLREVVIDDKLGICEELEQQMAHLVSRYQCEWRTTIESPEKRARFREFINTLEKDSHVQFVNERGQPRPARDSERNRNEAHEASNAETTEAH